MFSGGFGDIPLYPSLTTDELDTLERTITRIENAYTALTKLPAPPRPSGRPRGIDTGVKVRSAEEYRTRIRTQVYEPGPPRRHP